MSAGLIEHIFFYKFAAYYMKEFRNLNYRVIPSTFFRMQRDTWQDPVATSSSLVQEGPLEVHKE